MTSPDEYTLAALTRPTYTRPRRRWFIALALAAVAALGIGGTAVAYALVGNGGSPTAAPAAVPATSSPARVLSTSSPSEAACVGVRAAISSGDYNPDALLAISTAAAQSTVRDIQQSGALLGLHAVLMQTAEGKGRLDVLAEIKVEAAKVAAELAAACARAGF